jgi:F-type H+-transporting ATPase subunit a
MAEQEHAPNAIEHVTDNSVWEFFSTTFRYAIEWQLPKIFGFQITKFMLLEVIAAGLILAIFIPLARKARHGELPKGKFWNAFESLLTFVRNEIAKPNLGEKEADKYVPFLWSVFLFILFCNLIGLVPFMGAPTASIAVTGALALFAFIMIHGAAILKQAFDQNGDHGTDHGHGHDPSPGHAHGEHRPASSPFMAVILGLGRYVKSQWPHIEVPYVGPLFSAFIFVLEQVSLVIKSGVLSIRLFANIFAGHMVTISIMLFIYQVGVYTHAYQGHFTFFYCGVTAITVIGLAALSLLELFVCFLQAYVFTFLTALFMGMALHPEH